MAGGRAHRVWHRRQRRIGLDGAGHHRVDNLVRHARCFFGSGGGSGVQPAIVRAQSRTSIVVEAPKAEAAAPAGVQNACALFSDAALICRRGASAPWREGAAVLNGRSKMPTTSHTKAAEAHETAAKSHRSAAEHHGKNDHKKGQEHSTQAHGHSEAAHKHSTEAHGKSGQHAKK